MRKWFKSPRDPILTPTPELLLNCIKLGRAELSLLWNFKLNLDHRPACCRPAVSQICSCSMFGLNKQFTIFHPLKSEPQKVSSDQDRTQSMGTRFEVILWINSQLILNWSQTFTLLVHECHKLAVYKEYKYFSANIFSGAILPTRSRQQRVGGVALWSGVRGLRDHGVYRQSDHWSQPQQDWSQG